MLRLQGLPEQSFPHSRAERSEAKVFCGRILTFPNSVLLFGSILLRIPGPTVLKRRYFAEEFSLFPTQCFYLDPFYWGFPGQPFWSEGILRKNSHFSQLSASIWIHSKYRVKLCSFSFPFWGRQSNQGEPQSHPDGFSLLIHSVGFYVKNERKGKCVKFKFEVFL